MIRRFGRAAGAIGLALALLATTALPAAAGLGGQSRDITLDGRNDLFARRASDNVMLVYPHSGVFNGQQTFTSPGVVVGHGAGIADFYALARITGGPGPDQVARWHQSGGGELKVYPHSGKLNGTSTWLAPVTLGFGANINNFTLFHDVNNDGWDDQIAREAATGDLYVYYHSGVFNGTATFGARQLLGTGWGPVSWLAMADLTGDGVSDLIAADPTVDQGRLTLYPGDNGISARSGAAQRPAPRFDRVRAGQARAAAGWGPVTVGTGWTMMDTITLTDVNLDGWPDLVGKVTSNGELLVYPHSKGVSGMTTFGSPQLIGTGWQPFDIIT
ncbi:FG-GAP repeat domain-containing protein [Crossiella cryophila]|uniref:VCBS repeat-containing protein n=1 Tax=Crossiella cryophila TaxID=43355 RepID=A0A7W7CEU7_9PSEU|nr:VCBS repeat-containing protein [Crossiella cryophila]MBB4678244.1 hypothetical protein [Crossiella cryophila]